MKWFHGTTAAVATALALFSATDASAGHHACCVCQQKVCHLEIGEEEVDVNCFDVECEDVCIPPVRFWWECGPINRCGKVRTVHKLTTESHKKTECTYDWSVVTICRPCYHKVHRLRCHQLGLGAEATPEQVGLPTPTPVTDAESDEVVGFRIPQPVKFEGASVEPSEQSGMLTTVETPVRVADTSKFDSE